MSLPTTNLVVAISVFGLAYLGHTLWARRLRAFRPRHRASAKSTTKPLDGPTPSRPSMLEGVTGHVVERHRA